jgi:predicted ATP-dependent endonuclease of OLD family
MKLTNVEIKNFRSLDKLDFEFNPNCRILVGINESGKSNILKALAMLEPV